MIALTLLTACSPTPTETTDTTMVGQLVDADGTPLSNIEVNSVEGKHKTDAQGRFAVPIMPPSKLVHFSLDDVFYQRVQGTSDLGQAITVEVPARSPRTLTCPPIACDVTLGWRFESGFTAKAVPQCTPEATVELAAVPATPPFVSCREGRGTKATDHAVELIDAGTTWTIRRAGAEITVVVHDAAGETPASCKVQVGQTPAMARDDGTFVARAITPSSITAECDGSPARPAFVTPNPDAENRVTLTWAPTGPTVDVGAVAAWAQRVTVRHEDEGWAWSTRPTNGTVVLPPLSAGAYTVILQGTEGPVPESPAPITVADVISFETTKDQEMVGRLRLNAALGQGTVRTHVAPR
ncbi:MAG: hypothetical protein AAGA48_07145 [Myxococcota bacterium]